MNRRIIVIANNLRSCHNVGSLLRTADGIGVEKVFLTGYTPYPQSTNDKRLPHAALKQHSSIVKTSLGAEENLSWEHYDDPIVVINNFRELGFSIVGLEQSNSSLPIDKWVTPEKVAIIIGRETLGIEEEILSICDEVIEIPMRGKKESYNVVQAAAMMLYHCRFYE